MSSQEILNQIPGLITQVSSINMKVMIAIGVSLLTVCFSIYVYIDQKKQKRKESVKEQLSEFYGPLLSYLNVSETLYMILLSNKPVEFRLLPYLLYPLREVSGTKIVLNEADHEIIKEIINISDKIEELIIQKSGLVDDGELRYSSSNDDLKNIDNEIIKKFSLFSRVLINYKVVKMAYEKKFHNNDYNTEKLEQYVFPRPITLKIKENITKLQKELKS